MQAIIDKTDSPYLLPIIKDMNIDKRRQYKNAAHLVNNKLKKIGELLGLNVSLTSYVARHSWASIARAFAETASIARGKKRSLIF